jgi:MFS family permease
VASAPTTFPSTTLPAEASRVTSWRWVHVVIAALAMVLTLPGRTHGLGLFTEPLLKSLGVGRESYGFMNLLATLLGSLFCIPCGWLLDRFGTRAVYFFITSCLGATVMTMAEVLPEKEASGFELSLTINLFLFLLLTRGFGQSALSVVSLGLIGRSTGRRSGLAMGVYAFCVSAGFTFAFALLMRIVKQYPTEWRAPWFGIGLSVLILGAIAALFIRDGVLEKGSTAAVGSDCSEHSLTVAEALASPTFWTFTIGISFFGLVAAGTSLFNESILAERGFDKEVFATMTVVGIPAGLAANLLVGWLATRWSLAKLMTLATGWFAATLFCFSLVQTPMQVYAYAMSLGAAGGGMTVCFFAVYRRAFGPARLGTIQGIAQLVTVLFSAVGPLIFASTKVRMGEYAPLFPIGGTIAVLIAIATWIADMPAPRDVSA